MGSQTRSGSAELKLVACCYMILQSNLTSQVPSETMGSALLNEEMKVVHTFFVWLSSKLPREVIPTML